MPDAQLIPRLRQVLDIGGQIATLLGTLKSEPERRAALSIAEALIPKRAISMRDLEEPSAFDVMVTSANEAPSAPR